MSRQGRAVDKTQFIIENWQSMTDKELAEEMGIKPETICEKRYWLMLKRFEMIYWEPSEVEYLINNYKIKGDTEIAKDLTRQTGKKFTAKRVEKKRRSGLNLIRSEEEILSIRINNKPNVLNHPNSVQAKLKARETYNKRKIENELIFENLNIRIFELRSELIRISVALKDFYSSHYQGKIKTSEILKMENRKPEIIKEIQILYLKKSRLPKYIIDEKENRLLKVIAWVSITTALLSLSNKNK